MSADLSGQSLFRLPGGRLDLWLKPEVAFAYYLTQFSG